MSILLMAKVWDLPELDQRRKMMLLALADFANDEGCCWPKQETLARRCSMSRRTTQRVLADLEAEGWLSVDRAANVKGRSSTYWISLEMLEDVASKGGVNLTPLPCQSDATPASDCREGGVSCGARVASAVAQQEPSMNHQRTFTRAGAPASADAPAPTREDADPLAVTLADREARSEIEKFQARIRGSDDEDDDDEDDDINITDANKGSSSK